MPGQFMTTQERLAQRRPFGTDKATYGRTQLTQSRWRAEAHYEPLKYLRPCGPGLFPMTEAAQLHTLRRGPVSLLPRREWAVSVLDQKPKKNLRIAVAMTGLTYCGPQFLSTE
jgi:hypothetical protein